MISVIRLFEGEESLVFGEKGCEVGGLVEVRRFMRLFWFCFN